MHFWDFPNHHSYSSITTKTNPSTKLLKNPTSTCKQNDSKFCPCLISWRNKIQLRRMAAFYDSNGYLSPKNVSLLYSTNFGFHRARNHTYLAKAAKTKVLWFLTSSKPEVVSFWKMWFPKPLTLLEIERSLFWTSFPWLLPKNMNVSRTKFRF